MCSIQKSAFEHIILDELPAGFDRDAGSGNTRGPLSQKNLTRGSIGVDVLLFDVLLESEVGEMNEGGGEPADPARLMQNHIRVRVHAPESALPFSKEAQDRVRIPTAMTHPFP